MPGDLPLVGLELPQAQASRTIALACSHFREMALAESDAKGHPAPVFFGGKLFANPSIKASSKPRGYKFAPDTLNAKFPACPQTLEAWNSRRTLNPKPPLVPFSAGPIPVNALAGQNSRLPPTQPNNNRQNRPYRRPAPPTRAALFLAFRSALCCVLSNKRCRKVARTGISATKACLGGLNCFVALRCYCAGSLSVLLLPG